MTTEQSTGYIITRAKSLEEAERILDFFKARGIPMSVEPDGIFPSMPFALTLYDKKYMVARTLLAEEAEAKVNVLTGETIKGADWDNGTPGKLEVHNTERDTSFYRGLRSSWCDCDVEAVRGTNNFLCYPDDGACTCGIFKHHVHCKFCRGVSQIG